MYVLICYLFKNYYIYMLFTFKIIILSTFQIFLQLSTFPTIGSQSFISFYFSCLFLLQLQTSGYWTSWIYLPSLTSYFLNRQCRILVKSKVSGVRFPGFEFQLCYLISCVTLGMLLNIYVTITLSRELLWKLNKLL